MMDITLPNGEKALYVVEVQSDLHQQARKGAKELAERKQSGKLKPGETGEAPSYRDQEMSDAADSLEGLEDQMNRMERAANFRDSRSVLADRISYEDVVSDEFALQAAAKFRGANSPEEMYQAYMYASNLPLIFDNAHKRSRLKKAITDSMHAIMHDNNFADGDIIDNLTEEGSTRTMRSWRW
jgi:hypothetical protein